jgi:opacity protein-like surface antigen
MSILLRALAAFAMGMLLLPSVASAQNWSFAIGGGPGKTSDTNDGRAGDEDPSAHKTGFTGSLALGYALNPALRAEGEFGYIFFGAKKTAHQWRSAFAYQLRAGVGYAVSPTVDLFSAGYRYVHVNSGSVDQQQGSSVVRVNFDTIQNHSLEIGVTMRF